MATASCPVDGCPLEFYTDRLGRLVSRCRACERRLIAEAKLAEVARQKEVARTWACESCLNGRVEPRRGGHGLQPKFCDDCRRARGREASRRYQERRYAGLTPEEKAAHLIRHYERRRSNPDKHRAHCREWQRRWRAKKRQVCEVAA